MATKTLSRPSRIGRSASSPDPQPGARAAGDPALRHAAPACPSASPDAAKQRSCALLNEILADSMVLYSMYKKHHWLVAGPTFYQLHLLFDKHAEEQNGLIDLLAERVQSLGASPSAIRVMLPS